MEGSTRANGFVGDDFKIAIHVEEFCTKIGGCYGGSTFQNNLGRSRIPVWAEKTLQASQRTRWLPLFFFGTN